MGLSFKIIINKLLNIITIILYYKNYKVFKYNKIFNKNKDHNLKQILIYKRWFIIIIIIIIAKDRL